MSRCWPVRQSTGRSAALAASARTTGAILIASGRVPNTMRTFIYRQGPSMDPFARWSLRRAILPDQGIDPLRRIVGDDMDLPGLDDAVIFGLIATEHRDPLRQRVWIVG